MTAPSPSAASEKSLAEFAARKRQSKCNPFFAAACTSQKTLLSLQVWNLFAFSEQIMRAADCKPFVQKGSAFLDSLKYRGPAYAGSRYLTVIIRSVR